MKILYLVDDALMPLCKGGIGRATEVCAREMMARGHNVVVAYWNRKSGEDIVDDIPQFAFPDKKNRTHFESEANILWFGKFIAENRIDIIVFQCGAGWYFPFTRITKKFHIPVISVLHADPRSYLSRYRTRRFRWWNTFTKFLRQCRKYRYNCKSCDCTVLLSESLRSNFEMHLSRNLIKTSKIVAIPNTAPFLAQNVNFSAKKNELIFVGRMSFADKRPDYMLKIWQILHDRFTDWELRFVGDGDYMPQMRKIVSELALGNVFFEGFQQPQKYYEEGSILCMTSANESFGLVLVESQAFGCVPVAFESFKAARDIVDDGKNGMLVPAFDIEKYAETLAKLMTDRELRERLARQGLKDVERFSPKNIGDKWEALFRELCGKSK